MRLTDLRDDDLLLEIGAGTGQIGRALCDLHPCYRGFDASRAMLDVFGRPDATVLADGAGPWPAEAASVRAFFSSRALHLLPGDHVVAEIQRLASPRGAIVLIGRLHRDGVQSRLRAEKRRYVQDVLGRRPHGGRQRDERVMQRLCEDGAEPIEAHEAAAWDVEERASDVLRWWREKSTLAGLEVDAAARDAVLRHLERWASEHVGPLQTAYPSRHRYVLTGVRMEEK